MKITLSLRDYLKRVGSYDKIENFKWGRSAKKSEEWKSLTEEPVKGNPMYEVIGRFENVPPHFRPNYIHGGNSNGQEQHLERLSEK